MCLDRKERFGTISPCAKLNGVTFKITSRPERLLKTKVRFEYTELIESKSYFKYEDDYTNLVQRCEVCDVSSKSKFVNSKGILPQKIFYRPNLIFWIVMECGKAHFGRKGQKTLVSKFVPWDLEATRT